MFTIAILVVMSLIMAAIATITYKAFKDLDKALVITMAFGISLCIFGALVDIAVAHRMMVEAFNKGYAVQCVGKSGYYWECEGDR